MQSTFSEYLYSQLPSYYRHVDLGTEYTLKRYLDVLGTSLGEQLEETKDILTLIDVEKVDARFLPLYASMFGVEYDPSIPEEFQRRYLANLVDILKRKGTKEVIYFICRELTGVDVKIMEAHYLGFRTWGTNTHPEMLGDFTIPTTYSPLKEFQHYLMGDESTEQGLVWISFDAETLEFLEKYEKALRKYITELMPPYVTLRFNLKKSSTDTDILFVNNITYTHKDVIGFYDTIKSNVQYGNDYAIIKTKDTYNVNSNISSEDSLDIRNSYPIDTIGISIEDEDTMTIKMVDEYLVESNIEDILTSIYPVIESSIGVYVTEDWSMNISDLQPIDAQLNIEVVDEYEDIVTEL